MFLAHAKITLMFTVCFLGGLVFQVLEIHSAYANPAVNSAVSPKKVEKKVASKPAKKKPVKKKVIKRKKVTAKELGTPIYLYPEGSSQVIGDAEGDKPAIYAYFPPKEKQTGAAVVIYPGGGYHKLALGHEGKEVAEWFNSLGIAAFVTTYRHGKKYHHPVPMQDGQRAVRLVRSRAKEWNLDKNNVGIMGFSAGGHLASTVGTHFDSGLKSSKDSVDHESCRPDFMILCYPVINMLDDTIAHKGSRRNLLGEKPDLAVIKSLSNELHVTAKTPPTFLFHTNEDRGVKAENSLHFALALRKAGVPVELHLYQKGKHGLGFAKSIPGTATWSGRCEDWLTGQKLTHKSRVIEK